MGMGLRPFVMISDSMHPEVPKNILVLLSTHAPISDIDVGDNVAYVLGKVEAMHKVTAVSTDTGENSGTEAGESGEKTLVVRSLADQGESLVSADMYLGREVLVVPGVGGWIRGIVRMKWIVIGLAVVLIIAGCIPKGKKAENAAAQST